MEKRLLSQKFVSLYHKTGPGSIRKSRPGRGGIESYHAAVPGSAQASTGWASTQTRRSMMKAPVMPLLQTPLRLFVPNFTTGTNSSYM